MEHFNRVMKDGLHTDLADGQEFITARPTDTSHVGGVSNDTTRYDGRDAGVSDAVISSPYAPDDPATVVSSATGVQLSCDGAHPVSMSDVGTA